METRMILEKYIQKYYSDWFWCSRRWCSMLGIQNEAYDLYANVLLELCQKPEIKLQELVEHEESGDRKLFFYVRKMIQFEVYEYRTRKARRFCSVDLLPNLQQNTDVESADDDVFNEYREITAKMRADDFIDLSNQYTGQGRIYRFVRRVKTPSGLRAQVKYDAISTTGCHREFSRRSSALSFIKSQIPPPNLGIATY